MSHTDGGFGLTPNVIAQTSGKVTMTSRFLGLVGGLYVLMNRKFGSQINWWTIQLRGPHLIFNLEENMCPSWIITDVSFHGVRPSR